jgi:hypothetical protein
VSKKIFLPLPSFLEFLCFSRVLAGTSWHSTFKPFINHNVVNTQYFNSPAVCLQKTIERTPLNGGC